MNNDKRLALEFLDLLTTLELCIAVHERDGKTIGQINKEVVKCAKRYAARCEFALNKQVLKNVIKAPFPVGRVALTHRMLDDAV